MRYLWMMVTRDAYELPKAVELSARDLARRCGTTDDSIHGEIRYAKMTGCRSQYVKVPIKEDEYNELRQERKSWQMEKGIS